MKPNKPVGFAALLEKMPKRFVAQAQRVEERAKRKREAQAKRIEESRNADKAKPEVKVKAKAKAKSKDGGRDEWQDTVAQFNVKEEKSHGTA